MNKKLWYTIVLLVLCAGLLVFITNDDASGDHCLVYPDEPCEMPRHCYFPPYSEGYNDGSCPETEPTTTTTTTVPEVTTPVTTEPAEAVIYPTSDLPITG